MPAPTSTPAAPAATPPPTHGPTASPTPAATYNPATAPSVGNTAATNPELLAALTRRANKGVTVGAAPPPAPAKVETLPSTPAQLQQQGQGQQPAQKPATTEPTKPATKFTPSDERQPSPEPAAKPAEPAKPAATEQPTQPPDDKQLSGPAQLRAAYENVKAERDKILNERDLTRKESAEYRAKLEGLEKRIETLTTVEGRAKEMEKQLLAKDERLRILDYTHHEEFHDKYIKPYADAIEEGVSLVKDLMVDSEGRMGNEQDFQKVLSMPNVKLADEKAVELFGERMASSVVEAYRTVKRLSQAHQNALRDAAINSEKWQKERMEREAQERVAVRTEFERQLTDLATRYPTSYKPAEGDNEAAAARAEGERLATIVIDGNVNNEAPDVFLGKVAKVFHRAASWPMQELQLQRAQERISALETKLKQYEASEPDPTPAMSTGSQPNFAGAPYGNSQQELVARAQAFVNRRNAAKA